MVIQERCVEDPPVWWLEISEAQGKPTSVSFCEFNARRNKASLDWRGNRWGKMKEDCCTAGIRQAREGPTAISPWEHVLFFTKRGKGPHWRFRGWRGCHCHCRPRGAMPGSVEPSPPWFLRPRPPPGFQRLGPPMVFRRRYYSIPGQVGGHGRECGAVTLVGSEVRA